MNLMFFTIAPDHMGGGGRRVFSGLLNGFISLGHAVYVVSEKQYPVALRVQGTGCCEYFSLTGDSGTPCGPVEDELTIQGYINRKEIDVILCDTEYALSNLISCLPGFCQNTHTQIYALCHDQIWRDFMDLYKVPREDRESHPYYRYSEYLRGELLPLRLKLKTEAMRKQSGSSKVKIKDRIRHHISKAAPGFLRWVEVFKAYLRLQGARKNVAITSGIVSLTQRSAAEAAFVYGLPASRSIGTFGYIDEALERFDGQCVSFCMDPQKVIAFCRLSPEKNLDMIILSFIDALKINNELKLTIIGRNESEVTSDYTNYLRYLIEKFQCVDSVSIFENPSDDLLVEELGTSNVMICAQNCDFNLTIFEAMYLGKQVVVPATYSFPEELAKSRNIFANNIKREDFTLSILEATAMTYHYDKSEREFLASKTYDNYAASVSAFLQH